MPTWFPNLVHVEAAWLLWIVPFLMFLWWYSSRARRRVLRHWSESAGSLPARRGLGRLLLVLILVALVVALAGPEVGAGSVTPTTSARDLLLIVDVSQSMLAEDQPPLSRLARARQTLLELLDHLNNSNSTARVGLIVFAGNARMICPPTEDRAHLQQLIRDLSTESLGGVGRVTESQGAAIGTSFGSVLVLLNGWSKQAADDRDYTDCLIVSDGDDLTAKPETGSNPWASLPYRIHAYAIGDANKDWPIPQGNGYLMATNANGASERALTRRHDETLRKLTEARGGALILEDNSPRPLVTWWKREMVDQPTRVLQSHARLVPINRAGWFLSLAGVLVLLELAFGGARQRTW